MIQKSHFRYWCSIKSHYSKPINKDSEIGVSARYDNSYSFYDSYCVIFESMSKLIPY